ncbi:hypothetical protein Ciccas_003835 [Cichlidogyrus casuarinus]|uniref:BRCT domain-containing protein n=1 Tax=Cichlidogyrus casuarinus TaxID=1844966 RepID=A0ABD2QDF3_9PLAT
MDDRQRNSMPLAKIIPDCDMDLTDSSTSSKRSKAMHNLLTAVRLAFSCSTVDMSKMTFGKKYPKLICYDAKTATHLVVEKPKRTLKLIIARARGIPVVSSAWLEDFEINLSGRYRPLDDGFVSENLIPPVIDYPINDPDNMLGPYYPTDPSNRNILLGWKIYLVPDHEIQPSTADLEYVATQLGASHSVITTS